MQHEPTIFIVDDEEPVRLGLESMLATCGFRTKPFPNAQSFLDYYNASIPGCVILDIRMPGMDGLRLQKYLLENQIILPVIILSGHGDVPMAVEAMQNGAITFLQKPAEASVLLENVQKALADDLRARSTYSEREEIHSHYQTLTPREREVLDHLIQGKTTEAISRALGTSETTIRVQRASIRKKMHADSTTDLLRMMLTLRGEI